MKKKGIKSLVVLILLVCTFIMQSLTVFASDVKANPTVTLTINSGETTAISTYVDNVNSVSEHLDEASFSFLSCDIGTDVATLVIDMEGYRDLKQADRMKVVETALNLVKNSSMSEMSKNKIYNFISKQDESTSALVRQLSNDVNADFARAYAIFKPFSGPIGIFLGLFAIIIFVILTFMVMIDISYIALPLMRNMLTQPQGKPKFVSNEAWYAVKESDASTNEYKNTLGLYFKHKTSQFIVLGVCLLYLISGQIYALVGNMLDMLRGFVN